MKKGKKVLTVLYIMLLIIIIIFIGYKVSNLNKKETTPPTNSETNNEDESTIQYELIDGDGFNSKIVINGNVIDINGSRFTNILKLKDAIIFNLWINDSFDTIVSDENGNITSTFIGNNNQPLPEYKNVIKTKGEIIEKYIMKDNKLTIVSHNLGENTKNAVCEKKADEIFQYSEVFNYIGLGKFNKKSHKSIKAVDYIKNNKIICN